MEKLKQSEEEVIKLGNKIVEELNLSDGVDTLGKWMAQYVAELMLKIKIAKSDNERKKYQKECCDMIIKVWNHKESLPQSIRPFANLKPAIEVLEALKKDETKYPFWRNFQRIPSGNPLADFSNSVRTNSEQLFSLSVYTVLNKEFLEKEKK